MNHNHSTTRRRAISRVGAGIVAGSATIAMLAACSSPAASSSSPAASGGSSIPASTPSLDTLYAGNSVLPTTSGSPKPGAGKSLYIIVCGYAAAGCANEADGIEEAAKAVGWTTTKVDGKLNVGNAYVAAFTEAIAAKPDAIVSVGPDCATVSTSLQQAKDAGIPTILTLGVDCDDPRNATVSAPLYTAQLQYLPNALTYGDFEFARNKAIGDYIVNKTNGNAKVIELYYRYQVLGEVIHSAYQAAFKDCTGCSTVGSVEFNNNDLAGPALQQKIGAALSQYPDANALTYPFSSAAQLGNVSGAVRTAGRQDDLIAAGGEGSSTDLDVIRQGSAGLTAEAAYSSIWAGWGVVDTAVRLFAGEKPTPEGIGFSLVDKDHNLPAQGQAWEPVGLDYKTAYLQRWGLK